MPTEAFSKCSIMLSTCISHNFTLGKLLLLLLYSPTLFFSHLRSDIFHSPSPNIFLCNLFIFSILYYLLLIYYFHFWKYTVDSSLPKLSLEKWFAAEVVYSLGIFSLSPKGFFITMQANSYCKLLSNW